MRTSFRCLLLLVLTSGCSPDDSTYADQGGDAGDVRGEDGSADTIQQRCGEAHERLLSYVAKHRQCTRSDDCAIAGGCNDALGFVAVNASAREEAQRLASVPGCGWADGSLEAAVCEQGVCVGRQIDVSCGGYEFGCPTGYAHHLTDPADSSKTGACYKNCSMDEDAGCDVGFTCREMPVFTLPGVPPTPVEGTATVCRPPSSCELLLSIDSDSGWSRPGAERLTLLRESDVERKLSLWVENVSTSSKTFAYHPPCGGTKVSGLGTYDSVEGCLVTACNDVALVHVTLAPGERSSIGTARVTPSATTCNPNGLARGTYQVRFALHQVEGAMLCGPEPLELRVF